MDSFSKIMLFFKILLTLQFVEVTKELGVITVPPVQPVSAIILSENSSQTNKNASNCYNIKTEPKKFHEALEDCTADGHYLAFINASYNAENDPVSQLFDQLKLNKGLQFSSMWMAMVDPNGRWIYTLVNLQQGYLVRESVIQNVSSIYKGFNFKKLALIMRPTKEAIGYACYTCGSPSPKCDKSSMYHEGHCYWMANANASLYIDSVTNCAPRRGIPPPPKDKFLTAFLVGVQSSYGIHNMWMGLHKMDPGPNWLYSDDTVFNMFSDFDQFEAMDMAVASRWPDENFCTYLKSESSYQWKITKCKKNKKFHSLCVDTENPCTQPDVYFHKGKCYSKITFGILKCDSRKLECPTGSEYFANSNTTSYSFEYFKAVACLESDAGCRSNFNSIQVTCGCMGLNR